MGELYHDRRTEEWIGTYLRICLDPRDLKEVLKCGHYSCPTLEDVVAKMHGAHIFTVLDAKMVIGR